MAFYIKLRKTFEDASTAKYSFGSGDASEGNLAINKSSGEVTLLEALAGDEKNHFFNRAGAKIRKEWKEGRFPDLTEWAS